MFFGQLFTGDTVDQIKVCPRVGPKTAGDLLKFLNTEEELFKTVAGQYHLRYGDDWKKYLEENARLLWLIQDESWLEQEREGNIINFKVKQLWECPYDYCGYDVSATE